MDTLFDFEKAKEILEAGTAQAQEFMSNPTKLDELLEQLEEKLASIPAAGPVLADVPLMISMIKSYITKKYEVVSPKVIALLISAFLYLVKKKDLIDDSVPLMGYLDDLAIIVAAITLSKPELDAYSEWRKENGEAAEKQETV